MNTEKIEIKNAILINYPYCMNKNINQFKNNLRIVIYKLRF